MFYVFLYIYLFFLGIAFVTSIVSFRSEVPVHLQLIAVLIILTLPIELMANFGFKLFHIKGYRDTLYNVFALAEFEFYGLFFYLLNKENWVKKINLIFIYTFPIIWLCLTYFGKYISNWNSPASAIGGFFVVVFSLFYIYNLSDSEPIIRISRHSEFWISLGLIIYYSFEIPYLGILNFLVKNYPSVSKILLYISYVFNSIMYCFFTYAFLCRNKKS